MSFSVSVVVSQLSEFGSFPAGIMDQQGLSHLRGPVEGKDTFMIEVASKHLNKYNSRKMEYEAKGEQNKIYFIC